MAIYHCSVKVISRSDGRSVTGAAAYRSGSAIADERTGVTHDYTRKTGVDHVELLLPVNAPDWAHDRSRLWNAVEKIERRKDSQLAREVEVSIPRELRRDQMLALVRDFAHDQFVSRGMIADVAFHHLDGDNPHAHILLTMRDIHPDGFGKKNRDWNSRDLLQAWRIEWERHANAALERNGFDQRIDHRTLAAQGIDRTPQIHLGPNVIQMEQRGIRTDRGAMMMAIDNDNTEIQELKTLLEIIDHERDSEIARSAQRRADRSGDRTSGASVGDPGRGSRAGIGATETISPVSIKKPVENVGPTGGINESRATGGRPAGSGGGGGFRLELEAFRRGARGISRFVAGAIDRIIVLAESGIFNKSRRESGGEFVARLSDRIAGMDGPFTVTISRESGDPESQKFTRSQLLRNAAVLARQAALGADIEIQPQGMTAPKAPESTKTAAPEHPHSDYDKTPHRAVHEASAPSRRPSDDDYSPS